MSVKVIRWYAEITTVLCCRFLGISKFGGSALSVTVAAAIVVCLWIYNVAFNIPMFIWADVRTNHIGRTTCYPPGFHPVFALTSCITNVFVPLVITWTSNIGIVYKFKRSTNKVILTFSTYTGQNHFIKYCEASIVNSIMWTSNQRWNSIQTLTVRFQGNKHILLDM